MLNALQPVRIQALVGEHLQIFREVSSQRNKEKRRK